MGAFKEKSFEIVHLKDAFTKEVHPVTQFVNYFQPQPKAPAVILLMDGKN